MGGEAAGLVRHDQHDFALWEKRVDALMILGSGRGHFTVDGLRRALEDMGAQAFEDMSYYERWIAAITATRMARRKMLEVGTPVRIRAMSPPGHLRTPFYLRGKTGVIERGLGPFENPEQRAYALPAPEKQLYRVRFTMARWTPRFTSIG